MSKLKNVFVTTILSMVMLTTPVMAGEMTSSVVNSGDNLPQVIHQYVDAINEQDWEAYVNSYCPDIQESYEGFPSAAQVEDRTGILAIDSLSIYEAKELPATHISEVEPHFADLESSDYENIKYFYVGFEYDVCRESEFYYDGVKYALIATGTLDETSYIIGFEYMYHLDRLEQFGYEFASEAEEKAQNITNLRRNGVIVNYDNEVLYTRPYVNTISNIAEVSEVTSASTSEKTTVVASDDERENLEMAKLESSLVSSRSTTASPANLKLYLTSIEDDVTLTFDEYAKCVLPNEWYGSWKTESLKAGAVAIKTYAWYNVEHPRKPATDYDCHLTDQSANYQHYVANSNYPTTDAAVNAVSGIFMRNSDGVVFEATYGAGTQGEIGTAFGGWLSQWGTQYIATNYPEYDYTNILSYYYSFSDKSDGYIQVGYY